MLEYFGNDVWSPNQLTDAPDDFWAVNIASHNQSDIVDRLMKISAGLTRSDVVSVLEAEQLPRFTAGTYRVYLQYSTGSELKEPR